MVGGGLAGDRKPVRLRRPHHLDRSGGRQVLEVDPRAGEAREGEVAHDHELLGLRRLTGDPEARRPLALVHVAAGREHRVLAVLGQDDGLAQAAGVLHGPAHETSVRDARPVIGEEAHPELGHLAERRELLARPSHRDGAGRVDVARRGAPELQHLAHDAGMIDRRDGVGHGEDARVAAEGGRPGAGLDGLGLLLARLAEVAVEVDQAGAHDAPGRVEGAIGAERRTHRGDPAVVADDDVGVTLARAVDHPAALEDRRGHQPSTSCSSGTIRSSLPSTLSTPWPSRR